MFIFHWFDIFESSYRNGFADGIVYGFAFWLLVAFFRYLGRFQLLQSKLRASIAQIVFAAENGKWGSACDIGNQNFSRNNHELDDLPPKDRDTLMKMIHDFSEAIGSKQLDKARDEADKIRHFIRHGVHPVSHFFRHPIAAISYAYRK